MELKEFVSQSLLQIFEGVQKAQKKLESENGQIVPGHPYPVKDNSPIVASSNSQPIILVDFDVSVTAIEEEKTKGIFSIVIAPFGGGVQSSSETSNNKFSHLKFSVPVLLPRKS